MLSTNISRTKVKRKLNLSLRFLITPAITILVVAALIIFHQHSLVIKTVDCQMGTSSCPEAVISSLERIKGKSFLRLNQKEFQKEILGTGLVDQIDFSFKLPGKLICQAQPPTLSFLVKTAFSPITPSLIFLASSISASPSIELDNFIASAEGKTFQLLSTGTLNQSDSDSTDSNYFLIGETIPNKDCLIKVFAWLRSLTVSSIKPEKIYFLSDMIILKQNGEPDLVVNFSDDPGEILLALQRLNQAITIKKPIIIDFRYNHPILK